MNWRTTAWLAGAALGLALFITLFERPSRLARHQAEEMPRLLPQLDPVFIGAIEVRSATGSSVTLLATNGLWQIIRPDRYPARQELAERLIDWLSGLRGKSILSPAELNSRPGALAEFGLSPAALTVRITGTAPPMEVSFGSHSIRASEVFLQVAGSPGIFTADAKVADLLSAEVDAWRERTLLPVDRLVFDQLRVDAPGAAFTLARGTNNGAWEMAEPRPARADPIRVGTLLHRLAAIEILKFIPSTNAPPPEIAGLRPARLTISLARGTNEIYAVAFGASLTNPPALFAQRRAEADLLVVPIAALDLLRISYKDLLDRRLFRFDPSTIQEIDIHGPEAYHVTRQTNGWRILPQDLDADAALVGRLLRSLANLEVLDIAKEVVTDLDLSNYGLSPPDRRVALRTRPGDTNAVVALLETGALQDNRLFARVRGEQPVYLLNPGEVEAVPAESWRLRDRTPWRFAAPEVTAITVRHLGLETTFRRLGTNDWSVPPGLQNDINPFALEEALHQFGETRALSWIASGEVRAQAVGIGQGPEVTFELRGHASTNHLKVEFGKRTPAGNRYAATAPAGSPLLTFELLGAVCDPVLQELGFAEPTPTLSPSPP